MTKHNHKILFIFAYVAMPALLAWIGYEFSGFDLSGSRTDDKKILPQEQSVYSAATESDLAYYDLPRVSLSMGTNADSNGTMKLDLSLEVQKADLKRVNDFEPHIIEKILLFMRQQSFERFQQPDGARELRKGLEHEIRTGAFPIQIAAINVRRMVFE